MSRTRRVGMLDVSRELEAVFQRYGILVNEVVDDAMKEVGKEAEASLKQVVRFSPNGNPTGEYSKDWDLMVEPVKRYARRYVVYNVEHYQLTHLLESGHAKFLWGRAAGGSVKGYEHIKPINDRAQERIIEEITERIMAISDV